MATLCRVGRTSYPCFGPSGSWRTSLSLDTRESPVRSEELGCTSCCFGTESEKTISVKHKSRSWQEVWTHLLSEKGTVVSCGPFAIPYHAWSRRIKRCFYTQRNLLWDCGKGSIADRPFCFPTCFAVVARQKIVPNGVHSCIQWMKWNDGLFPAAHQRGEARQSYGRASVGLLQPFPWRSTPKWRKIAFKMGVLSTNLKNGGFAAFFAAKPSVLLQNSVLGLKVNEQW